MNEGHQTVADVKAFGAVGDGVADDTEALAKAFGSGVGVVLFPKGRYRITRSIVLDFSKGGRLAVRGAGAAILHEGPGPALDVQGHHEGTANPDTVDHTRYENEAMPFVEGIDIIGAHEQADGIRLEGTFKTILSHVLIRRCRYGVHLVRRNRNVIIDNSHIYHNRKIGIYLDHVNLHQINITGNHISYNGEGGIKVADGAVRNIQINGNDIEYNYLAGGSDIWFVAGEGGVREGAVCGNSIQALAGRGGVNVRIEGFAPASPRKIGHLSIAGNHIANQSEANIKITDSRGIAITGNTIKGAQRQIVVQNSRAIVIGNNTLDENPDYNLGRQRGSVGGVTLRGSRDCTVQGLVMTGASGGSEERGGALEAFDCERINISGCTITGALHRAIWLENVVDSQVSGCILLQGDYEERMKCGLVEAGGSDRNLFYGNRVGGGEAAFSTTGPNSVLANNLI